MKEFQKESEFFDVTLVTGDGKQIRANKIVLAGASKFFHKIIKDNPHPHPLIYLKGVTAKNLLYLLDYMYTGEVNIVNDDVDDFIDTAEDLKVKGLDTTQDQNNANQTNTRSTHSPTNRVSFGEFSSSHHESETSSRSRDNMDKPVQNPQVKPAHHQSRLPLLIASATSSSVSSNKIFLQTPYQKDCEDSTVKLEVFHEDTNVKVEVVDETAAPMETDNGTEVAGKWENSFRPENMDSVHSFGDEHYDEALSSLDKMQKRSTEGETYEQKDHFKMNRKRLKGEKPYQCSRCSRSYSEMQHLEMHMDRNKNCSQPL